MGVRWLLLTLILKIVTKQFESELMNNGTSFQVNVNTENFFNVLKSVAFYFLTILAIFVFSFFGIIFLRA